MHLFAAGDAEEQSEVVRMFLEISEVPRCSGYNEKIAAYVVGFAEKNGLGYSIDGLGNVMVDHPGTVRSGILLQAHLDMVPVCDEGVEHDFTKDPIETVIENGYVHAVGTTLGADDGAGIAICLCALNDDSLKDVHFRCIFTVDEETTFIGVNNLDPGWFEGMRYCINLDNEFDDCYIIGSAGAIDKKISYTPFLSGEDRECRMLTIGGLVGGHSGADIDKGHPNPIMLALGFISGLDGAVLSSVSGGEAINSIPKSCSVVFACDGSIGDAFEEFRAKVVGQYSAADPSVSLTLDPAGVRPVWSKASTDDFLRAFGTIDYGVIRKEGSDVITSATPAVIKPSDTGLEFDYFVRSASESDLGLYSERAVSSFTAIGAHLLMTQTAPAWFDGDRTELSGRTADIMKDVFGRTRARTVHIALECGSLKSYSGDLQIVSIGPNMSNVHSTAENMEIRSLNRIFRVVQRLILEGI